METVNDVVFVIDLAIEKYPEPSPGFTALAGFKSRLLSIFDSRAELSVETLNAIMRMLTNEMLSYTPVSEQSVALWWLREILS